MYGFNVLFIRANPAEGHVESAALSVSVGLSSSPGSTRLEILHSGMFFILSCVRFLLRTPLTQDSRLSDTISNSIVEGDLAAAGISTEYSVPIL